MFRQEKRDATLYFSGDEFIRLAKNFVRIFPSRRENQKTFWLTQQIELGLILEVLGKCDWGWVLQISAKSFEAGGL